MKVEVCQEPIYHRITNRSLLKRENDLRFKQGLTGTGTPFEPDSEVYTELKTSSMSVRKYVHLSAYGHTDGVRPPPPLSSSFGCQRDNKVPGQSPDFKGFCQYVHKQEVRVK